MKQTEITRRVEKIKSLLPSSNGIFGLVEITRTSTVRIHTKIPAVPESGMMWEPEFRPLFQIKHQMDKEWIRNPLYFSIGRNEIWISTWWLGTGTEDALNDPFVLSWKKFLEVNNIPQTTGLEGSCNAEIFSLEKGLQILELWIDWVLKYS